MKVSIIIPTLNEAGNIGRLVQWLRQEVASFPGTEIIVTDAASTDGTAAEASEAGATVCAVHKRGRAVQMNAGAAMAGGEVLYFLHSDSFPPPGFITDIEQALQQGAKSGCFRLQFDHPHWFLRLNAWFTRFNSNSIRFGDQSLFVLAEVFRKSGGFNEQLIVMEDQEIIHRLQRTGKFTIIPKAVTTSARKYLANGVYRLQGVFFLIWLLYYLGVPQQRLVQVYKWLIR